jgi:predicted outer membrane repeat protein
VDCRVVLDETDTIGNTAQDGGGLTLFGGALLIQSGSVRANVAAGGGGGIYSQGTVTLTYTTVSDNVAATDGGGILDDQGELLIVGTSISGNEAQGLNGGGGVFSTDGRIRAVESVFANNRASDTDGGGIWIGRTLELTNVTLAGNVAQARGGGLFVNFGAAVTLTHVTVHENRAVLGTGGGLYLKEQITATLVNGIVSDNTSENCAGLGSATSGGYTLDSDGTCGLAGTGDLSGVDPQLGPLEDNGGHTLTHRLLSGSPAIDVIPLDRCPVTADQRGVARPQQAACDMGAYEAEPIRLYFPFVRAGG